MKIEPVSDSDLKNFSRVYGAEVSVPDPKDHPRFDFEEVKYGIVNEERLARCEIRFLKMHCIMFSTALQI